MIETVTALLLFLNGSMIEHVYKPDLGACLKSKRIAPRELNPERVIFSCKIVKAKIELLKLQIEEIKVSTSNPLSTQ